MAQPSHSNLLSYDHPAGRWLDALPLGNGRLGVMLFGDPVRERLALNHEDLWRGVERHVPTTPVAHHLPELRRRFFAGELRAATLETIRLIGQPNYQYVEPYQPVGDLTLDLPGHQAATDYRRSLDIAAGVATVRYRVGTVTYTRELFVSAAHGVIVLRLTADAPGAITGAVRLGRIDDPDCTLHPWAEANRCGFTATFPEDIAFATEARITLTGGTVTPAEGAALAVRNADALLLVLAIDVAVDHQADPAARCAAQLDALPPYDALHAAHVAEHTALFSRVTLDIPRDPVAEALPTDARLARLRNGEDDPGLVALYFQYGRYLLMSASRHCVQPANLQGLWSEKLVPEWGSDFHNNINIQMNYWPAEVCNLSECTEPLFSYLQRGIPNGRQAARDLYGCRGIVLPHATDVWTRGTLENDSVGIWTVGAPWLAAHLWWHYEYAPDEQFLREQVYPYHREVAAFFEDYLVRDPQGRLVPVPSISPENCYLDGEDIVLLGIGATMDLELIREALEHAIRAAEILNCDAEDRQRWQAIIDDLPPFQIGKHGQLQEWLEDFEEHEPGHRHVSHLYAVHPGEQMTPEIRPEFYAAARVALERRLAFGGGHTGWSRAWTAMFWARFQEGGLAYEHFIHLLTDFTTNSLLDLHPPEIFQIDGNLGGAAAVAEFLLQSHANIIRLLPALPPKWPTGAITGLRARGGITANMRWQDGTLQEATLHATQPTPCRLSLPAGIFLVLYDKVEAHPDRDNHGHLCLNTTPGMTVTIRRE